MRALTLYQPWASLVAEGIKTLETRPWLTRYRGLLLIHAARALSNLWPRVGDWHIAQPSRIGGTPHVLKHRLTGIEKPMPLGAIVAVVELVTCVPTSELAWEADGWEHPRSWRQTGGFEDHALSARAVERWGRVAVEPSQRPYGDFSDGRYAFPLANVRKLAKPIPAKGRQKLWIPDDELVAQVEAVTA